MQRQQRRMDTEMVAARYMPAAMSIPASVILAARHRQVVLRGTNLAEPSANLVRSDDPFRLVRVDRSGGKSHDLTVIHQLPGELLCILFGHERLRPSCVPIRWRIALINEGDVPDVLQRHVATLK